jgi:hypothetical protein
MQDYLSEALSRPLATIAGLEAARAAGPLPLALKMCAGCTAQFAVEGDVGDEQGGTTWFGPCCPVPDRYAAVFIREAAARRGRAGLRRGRRRRWRRLGQRAACPGRGGQGRAAWRPGHPGSRRHG